MRLQAPPAQTRIPMPICSPPSPSSLLAGPERDDCSITLPAAAIAAKSSRWPSPATRRAPVISRPCKLAPLASSSRISLALGRSCSRRDTHRFDWSDVFPPSAGQRAGVERPPKRSRGFPLQFQLSSTPGPSPFLKLRRSLKLTRSLKLRRRKILWPLRALEAQKQLAENKRAPSVRQAESNSSACPTYS